MELKVCGGRERERGWETCQLHSPGANLGRLRQLVSEFLFLCKGQPLHFEGQPSHPKNCNLKSAWGQGGTPNRSFFGWGNLGRIFWAPSESRGSSTAGTVQWGATGGASVGGKERGRLPRCQLPPLGNGESRRRGVDSRAPDGPEPGPRTPRFAVGAWGGEGRGCRPLSLAESASRASRDSARGRSASGNGGPRRRGGDADSPYRQRLGTPGSHFRSSLNRRWKVEKKIQSAFGGHWTAE
nr:uncharacterized protein LOC116283051 [Vicugna pacos]